MALPQFYDADIVKAEKLNDNTILLKLKTEAHLSFKAGQFVLTYLDVNGKEENRAFSIASPPSKDIVELLIRKYDQGKVSPLLFNLKEQDKLKIRGPFGIFTVKTPLQEETVFIASGTGIVPLRSMVHEILENYPENKVTLFFGFRHQTDKFFKKE